MFFRRAGLQPGLDLQAVDINTVQEQNAFLAFQLDNLDRLTSFLTAPNESSPIGADGLGTRGAIWSFLRYAADRYARGEAELWHRLVRDTRWSGLENLAQALGGDPREWMRDWAVAM